MDWAKSKSHDHRANKGHSYNAPQKAQKVPSHGSGHGHQEPHGTVVAMLLMCTCLLIISVILLAYYVYYKRTYFIPEDTEESEEDLVDELERKKYGLTPGYPGLK